MARTAESILLTGKLDVCVTTLSQSFRAHDWEPMTVRLVKVRTQSITPAADGGETATVYLRAYQLENDDVQALSHRRKGSLVSRVITSRRRRNSVANMSDLLPIATHEVPLEGAVLNFGDTCSEEEDDGTREIALTYSGRMYRLHSDSYAAISEWRDRIKQTHDKKERSFTGCLVVTENGGNAAGTRVSLVFHPPAQPQAIQLHQVDIESALIDHVKLSSVIKFGVKCTNEVFWMKVDRGGRQEDIEILHKEADKIADSMSSFIAMQGRVMKVNSKSWETVVSERRLPIPPADTPNSHHYINCYNAIGGVPRGRNENIMVEKHISFCSQSAPSRSTHLDYEELPAAADLNEEIPQPIYEYAMVPAAKTRGEHAQLRRSTFQTPSELAWQDGSMSTYAVPRNALRARLLNEPSLLRSIA